MLYRLTENKIYGRLHKKVISFVGLKLPNFDIDFLAFYTKMYGIQDMCKKIGGYITLFFTKIFTLILIMFVIANFKLDDENQFFGKFKMFRSRK